MNFLNPLFLLALAAVAVPLLIHIFSRRRVPEVPFSTLRFLRRSDRRSMRRINLRRLLLLILRMAAIALVALAFARPVVRGGMAALFPVGGDRAACVLLDRSYSMRVEEDEGTLFRRAVGRTAEIMEQLDRNDEVSVILFDTGRQTLYAGRQFDREVVLSSLREQEPSWHGTDLRAALHAGREVLAGSRRQVREMYIVSDFQRSALKGGRQGSEGGETGMPQARVFIVPVQPEPGTNVAIEEVLTPRVTLHRGELARLAVTMKNGSRDLEARFPLTVAVDGRRIMEKEMAIQPGGVAVEEISFPVEREGWLRGEVRKGRDRLPPDDGRFFTLRVQDRMGVLLVADEAGFYLEQALSPEGSEGDIALVKRRWREITTADLEGAEALVIGSGGGPGGSDIELIRRFIENGGKALVLLLPELESLVRGLSGYAIDIEFRRIREGFITVAPPRGTPPLLAPFDTKDIEALTALRFRAVPYVRGVDHRAVVLRFSDGSPFIWEERLGAGTIVFAAIDPRRESGDLVLSPYFLPLIQQALLATGQEPPAGEGGVVGVPVTWSGECGPEYVCRLPGGGEVRPEQFVKDEQAPDASQRPGSGSPAGGIAGSVILPPAQEPGFITISRGAGVTGLIAINPDCRSESDLDCMSGAEVADSLGITSSMVLGAADGLTAGIHRAREGREISTTLIIAAIILFALELVVAQRMRGEATA
ncbi:MAG TPA: VWA domain-containing protein [Patescibacteria group bacterium]|nr:VWA domain-containing protein [Patescibacteria group bacterium]